MKLRVSIIPAAICCLFLLSGCGRDLASGFGEKIKWAPIIVSDGLPFSMEELINSVTEEINDSNWWLGKHSPFADLQNTEVSATILYSQDTEGQSSANEGVIWAVFDTAIKIEDYGTQYAAVCLNYENSNQFNSTGTILTDSDFDTLIVKVQDGPYKLHAAGDLNVNFGSVTQPEIESLSTQGKAYMEILLQSLKEELTGMGYVGKAEVYLKSYGELIDIYYKNSSAIYIVVECGSRLRSCYYSFLDSDFGGRQILGPFTVIPGGFDFTEFSNEDDSIELYSARQAIKLGQKYEIMITQITMP